jgi:hypothetical protein
MFVRGLELTQEEHLKEAPLYGRLLALPTIIRNGLEGLARDQHSSLLRTLVNYGRKKFYNIGPRNVQKSFSQPLKGLRISGRIHNTSFSYQLTNGTNNLECLSLAGLSSIV